MNRIIKCPYCGSTHTEVEDEENPQPKYKVGDMVQVNHPIKTGRVNFITKEGKYMIFGIPGKWDEQDLIPYVATKQSSSNSIDWEVRRFELIKAALQGHFTNSDMTFSSGAHIIANIIIKHVDEIIEKLKAE